MKHVSSRISALIALSLTIIFALGSCKDPVDLINHGPEDGKGGGFPAGLNFYLGGYNTSGKVQKLWYSVNGERTDVNLELRPGDFVTILYLAPE